MFLLPLATWNHLNFFFLSWLIIETTSHGTVGMGWGRNEYSKNTNWCCRSLEYLGLQGLHWQTSNYFSEEKLFVEEIIPRVCSTFLAKVCQRLLLNFFSASLGTIGSPWLYWGLDWGLVITCSGLHSTLVALMCSVDKSNEYNWECGVVSRSDKCEGITKCSSSFQY